MVVATEEQNDHCCGSLRVGDKHRFGRSRGYFLLAIPFFARQHLWITDKMIMEVVAEILQWKSFSSGIEAQIAL